MYMYKEDLVLNNLQGLIHHKTKPNPHIVPIIIDCHIQSIFHYNVIKKWLLFLL